MRTKVLKLWKYYYSNEYNVEIPSSIAKLSVEYDKIIRPIYFETRGIKPQL